MNEKERIYRELVRNENPNALHETWDRMEVLEWSDDDEQALALTPREIGSILQRYQAGALSDQQIEDWANYIEAVSYDKGGVGEEAMHIIHCLANPVLEGPLTQEKAQRLIALLAKGMPTEEETFAAYVNTGTAGSHK